MVLKKKKKKKERKSSYFKCIHFKIYYTISNLQILKRLKKKKKKNRHAASPTKPPCVPNQFTIDIQGKDVIKELIALP